VIRREDGLVLTCERAKPRGAWQFPQGGIEKGETPDEALFREVLEETAVPAGSVTIVGRASRWLTYEHPDRLRRKKNSLGQTQLWFLLQLEDSIEVVSPQEPEFISARWTPFQRAVDDVVDFKRHLYEMVGDEFADHLVR